jgi:hypothetical protein
MRNQKLLTISSLLALAFLLFSFNPQTAFGQTCSSFAQVNKSGFRRGAQISVYIDPALQGAARTAAEQAFRNWNTANALANNGSQVHFNFVTTPPPAGTGITVGYANVISPDVNGNNTARASAQTHYDGDGFSIGANILLHNAMTDPAAVLETMSHEIGHPMGFGHCSCGNNESVMSLVNYDPSSAASMNTAYGRATAPTDCDNANARDNAYGPCSANAQTDCANNGGIFEVSDCTCRSLNGGGGTDCSIYPSAPGCGGGSGGWSPDYPGGGCTSYYWVQYLSYDGGRTWQVDPMWIPMYAGCW